MDKKAFRTNPFTERAIIRTAGLGGHTALITSSGWRLGAKDRRQGKRLPREHGFSGMLLGAAVVCVVIAVMFAI